MNTISFVPYQLIPAEYNPWRPILIEAAKVLISNIYHPDFEYLHFG